MMESNTLKHLNRRALAGLCVIAGMAVSCPVSSAALQKQQRGPAGLAAPINGRLVSSPVEHAHTATNPAGDQAPTAVQWSAAIKPAGATNNLSWLLPMCGPLSKVGGVLRTAGGVVARTPREVPKKLEGGISLADENQVGQRIDELLDAALDRDPKSKTLDKAVAHYRTTTQKVIAETKDATDYLVPYRGFGPSSEAADIILDEKVKLKSRASAEYARQKHVDEIHLKVVTNVMQVAMGLGMSDQERGQQLVSSGLGKLEELVGKEEAQKTLTMLAAWSKELSVPDSLYSQDVWDVEQRQHKFKYVMETSLDNDQVVHEITKRLHKYNQRSKFARVSAHVVQTTLGVAALTPNFVGPAAKLALLTFVMATGGPEQCKLLKELYLDKRFESRWKVINEEAHMALENYQLALLTRNPVLLACSESLVEQMTSPEHVQEVFGTRILAQAPASGEIQGSGAAPAVVEGAAGPALAGSTHLVGQ